LNFQNSILCMVQVLQLPTLSACLRNSHKKLLITLKILS
jgi:hypothetical protein